MFGKSPSEKRKTSAEVKYFIGYILVLIIGIIESIVFEVLGIQGGNIGLNLFVYLVLFSIVSFLIYKLNSSYKVVMTGLFISSIILLVLLFITNEGEGGQLIVLPVWFFVGIISIFFFNKKLRYLDRSNQQKSVEIS